MKTFFNDFYKKKYLKNKLLIKRTVLDKTKPPIKGAIKLNVN
jgi:hypothetical protein